MSLTKHDGFVTLTSYLNPLPSRERRFDGRSQEIASSLMLLAMTRKAPLF
jgi:hypothetical protein